MLVSDGSRRAFQNLGIDVPVVARLFSQNLYDRFSRKAGALFPLQKRPKQAIREQIDRAIFHGGTVRIEEDAQHTRRLRLVHQNMHPGLALNAHPRGLTDEGMQRTRNG
jgi:hypothetical protein